jgi:hypothetical protein
MHALRTVAIPGLDVASTHQRTVMTTIVAPETRVMP